MFCLSKGLGAPVGSVLCGPADVIAEARGAPARAAAAACARPGVIAAAGIVALETMVERLADDHARARRLADALARRVGPGSVDPDDGAHQHRVRRLRRASRRLRRRGSAADGVRAGTIDPRTVRFVTHKDVDDDDVDRARSRRFDEIATAELTMRRTTDDARPRARDLRASRRSRDLGRRHARALGRRGRRGARGRHDARRQGHATIPTPTSTRSPRSGSRRPRPRRACSGSPSTIISTIPTASSPTTARCGSSSCALIRAVRPDVVCCPDPTAVFFGDAYFNHRDHRVTGWATLDAVAPAAGNPHYFPELRAEGLDDAPGARACTSRARSSRTCWVDIGATLERKIEALFCHASQLVETGDGSATSCANAAEDAGRVAGVQFAEAFRTLTFSR